jgi:hypothetical protein
MNDPMEPSGGVTSSQLRSEAIVPEKRERKYDKTRPWMKYPSGYARFAAFIATDKDKSTTIYRRFERLAARNLLDLESELTELEAEQDQLDEETRIDHDLGSSARNWRELRRQATVDENSAEFRHLNEFERTKKLQLKQRAEERLEVTARVRGILKEYCMRSSHPNNTKMS